MYNVKSKGLEEIFFQPYSCSIPYAGRSPILLMILTREVTQNEYR